MTTPPETTDPASTTTMRQIKLSTKGVELETTPNSDSAHHETSAPTLQPGTDVNNTPTLQPVTDVNNTPTLQPDPDVISASSHGHNLANTPTTQPDTDVNRTTSHGHILTSTSKIGRAHV